TSEIAGEAKIAAFESASVEQKHEQGESKAEEVQPATFAEHKNEQTIGPREVLAQKEEDQKDTPTISGQAEVVAAISALESGNGKTWNTTGSGNGAGHSAAQSADSPGTMVAAAVGSSTGPRWTAVPVSIDAAESAISLE